MDSVPEELKSVQEISTKMEEDLDKQSNIPLSTRSSVDILVTKPPEHCKGQKAIEERNNDDHTPSTKDDTLLKVVETDAYPLLNGPYDEEEDEVDALPSNLRYNNFDLTYTLISVLTYLFDLIMDCAVAYYFYHLAAEHGIYHYWYFGLTVSFILLPSLTIVSYTHLTLPTKRIV